jgi:hypothetical protein
LTFFLWSQEFYLTDPDSSSSDINPGSVTSVNAHVEAFAFPAGPIVVVHNDQPLLSADLLEAVTGPAAASGPRHRPVGNYGSDEHYFRPVMEVLAGERSGDGSDDEDEPGEVKG